MRALQTSTADITTEPTTYVFIFSDSRNALELLERIQDKLHGDGSPGSNSDINAVDEDLSSLIYLLDSPLFSQLLAIQDALHQLKQVGGPNS